MDRPAPARRRPASTRPAQPPGRLGRIVIQEVRPSTPDGFPAKAVVGERVALFAAVFTDGHDVLAARVRWRRAGQRSWRVARLTERWNDEWHGHLVPEEVGAHELVVEAWTDRYATWRHHLEAKLSVGDDVGTELAEAEVLLRRMADQVGERAGRRLRDAADQVANEACSLDVRLNAALDDAVRELLEATPDPLDLTTSGPHPLTVDPPIARSGAWYEMFPRSEGGLAGAAERLPAIAEMGFDIVYLPPVHPIGTSFRKGPGNTLVAGPGDPGSPWAIGGPEGGHTALHPELGTWDDFDAFVARAGELGLQVALDYALQCSPDHPWVQEHPEWFHHRPDGSIRYAENPPKKYQDIYPINFWPEREADRAALWSACEQIFEHWIARGVHVFRVDNPHTKPLAFWAWVLPRLKARHPELVFLSEAFTRPRMMSKLAEVGFTQSYTYFTWRTTAQELREYVEELAHGRQADWFRPCFWPNTPDILSGPLRGGPRSAFLLRMVLAATLSPAWGLYSGYELCENEPASEHNEEYHRSEKYELRPRQWDRADSLAPVIARVNAIRRAHPALAELRTTRFWGTSGNDAVLAFSKADPSGDDVVLVVVNLDPHRWQETTLQLDLAALGLPADRPYTAHDELTGTTFRWHGDRPYVRLDPAVDQVAHILHLQG